MTVNTSTSSEFFWLLTLLRKSSNSANLPLFQTLTPDEWGRIVELACKFQIGSLLYHRVKAFSLQNSVSRPLLHKLQAIHYQVASQNLRNSIELSLILKALAEVNIPVILLKGAHLAHFVYSSLALRSMSDIDILVLEKDLNVVREQLVKLGFRLNYTEHRVDNWEKPNILNLEVHWRLIHQNEPFNLNLHEWWPRAIPVVIQQANALVFCPEDLLLHICFHASYHHLFELRFRFLCDIVQVIECFQEQFDWSAFIQRTNEFGLQRGVYICLLLAQEWLDTVIPANVLADLAPYAPTPQLLEQIKFLLIHPEQFAQAEGLSRNMSEVVYSTSCFQKIKVLFSRLFPSPKELALIYQTPFSPWQIYFYYPVRFNYLWRRYLPIAWRLWYGEAPLRNVAQFQNALLQWLRQTNN